MWIDLGNVQDSHRGLVELMLMATAPWQRSEAASRGREKMDHRGGGLMGRGADDVTVGDAFTQARHIASTCSIDALSSLLVVTTGFGVTHGLTETLTVTRLHILLL